MEAYYYICLECAWVHPGSGSGGENWEFRRKVEEALSMKQIDRVWKRVDLFVSKERKRENVKIWPPAFYGTGNPEDKWNKWRKDTDENESRHRKSLRAERAKK